MVIAQRLLRRICTKCKEPYEVPGSEIAALGMEVDPQKPFTIYRGRGCELCHKSGFKGRVGIYEVLEINEEMRQLVVRKSAPSEIRAAATRSGVEPLRAVAVKKLVQGLTSIDEVIRVTVAEESAGG